MKKYTLLYIIGAIVLASCGGKGTTTKKQDTSHKTTAPKKASNIIHRNINIAGEFTHLLSMCGADIVYTQGDYNIEVEGDSALLQYLGFDIDSSVLTITLGSQAHQDLNIYEGKSNITINISAPSLQCVSLCSSGDFTSHGLWKNENVEMGIISTGSFSCDSIECKTLSLQSSGKGSASFANIKAANATIDNLAESNINATLDVDYIRAINKGNSTMTFNGRAGEKEFYPTESGKIVVSEK